MPHRFRAVTITAAVMLVALAAAAHADDRATRIAALAQRMKQVQHEMLMREGQARMEGREENPVGDAESAEESSERTLPEWLDFLRDLGVGARLERPRAHDTSDPGAAPRTSLALRNAAPARVAGLAPNVRVNNPALDVLTNPRTGQSEEGIAVFGNNVLVAFNDGEGFNDGSGDTQGYAYSTDGGATFTDGGVPAKLPSWHWTSDPVVIVNEANGDFWYGGLTDPATGQSGIGLVRARFVADTIQWGTPSLVRFGLNTNLFLDKPWFAADSSTGRIYAIYTAFGASGDTIDFQFSADSGATWSNPQQLSSFVDAGYVQGPRVLVGPTGTVFTSWYAIGQNCPYNDFFRFRASTNGGVSFGAEHDAATLFSNFASGAPGFNRERGITFPSMAVDRSYTSTRNRVYLAWNESVNFFDDNVPGPNAHRILEAEPNNTPAQANAFAIGDSITGQLTGGDLDYYKFTATQGQTGIFFVNTIDPSLDATMRIFCTDGTTRLAYSEPGQGLNNLIVFTFPTTGIYYLRMAQALGSGSYTIYSALDAKQAATICSGGDRARDHRDAFVAYSDDQGSTWSTPKMVNDDSPWYDNWLPEVAVSGQGKPYVIWYDWRDAPASTCGGVSNVYLARSDDNGASWFSLGAVTDTQSQWPFTTSNISPNQGDYLGLFANAQAVFPCWADDRDTAVAGVDVYMSRLPLAGTPTELALSSVTAQANRVTLSWYAAGIAGLEATVYRRASATAAWLAIGDAAADGSGQIVYVDATVTPGSRYDYRVGIHDPSGLLYSQETWVDVPLLPRLAIQSVRPNPAAYDLWVSFSLPGAAPATLELLDIAGRRVLAREIAPGAAASQLVNLTAGAALRPGLYLVRLTQAGRSVTARAAIVR